MFRTPKFRTETYEDVHTVDGIPATITRTRQVPQPLLPRDWDRAALRAATGLVLTLTLGVVVWSTWAIGTLIGGGVGFVVAPIFDLAWAVCLLLEWMARFDPEKRRFPRLLGWALLAVTMGALFWHGAQQHDWAMACVGASVSLVGKGLWWGVQAHVDRKLSSADQQWVNAQFSKANAMMAVSSVRRQAARLRAAAAAELLAMEAAYGTDGHAAAEAAEDQDDALPVAPATPAPGAAPSYDGASATPAPAGATSYDVASATPPAAEVPALPAAPAAAPALDAAALLAELLAAVNAAAQAPAPAAAVAPSAEGQDDAEDAELLDDDEDQDDEDAEDDGPLEPPTLATLSKADAVRIALRRRPAYSGQQIADLLSGYGVTVTDAYVRQVRGRDQRRAEGGASAEVVTLHPTAD